MDPIDPNTPIDPNIPIDPTTPTIMNLEFNMHEFLQTYSEMTTHNNNHEVEQPTNISIANHNDNDGLDCVDPFDYESICLNMDDLPYGPYALAKYFEQISRDEKYHNRLRQYTCMRVPDDIDKIQPGQYCELTVSGSGYTQWYYYKSLSGIHMLIIGSNGGSLTHTFFSGREIGEIPTNT